MSPQKHLNCKLQNETYPIEKIEDGTIILFLSPEEYFVSNEMRELNKRFEFSHVFDNFRKVVGTVFFIQLRMWKIYCVAALLSNAQKIL